MAIGYVILYEGAGDEIEIADFNDRARVSRMFVREAEWEYSQHNGGGRVDIWSSTETNPCLGPFFASPEFIYSSKEEAVDKLISMCIEGINFQTAKLTKYKEECAKHVDLHYETIREAERYLSEN